MDLPLELEQYILEYLPGYNYHLRQVCGSWYDRFPQSSALDLAVTVLLESNDRLLAIYWGLDHEKLLSWLIKRDGGSLYLRSVVLPEQYPLWHKLAHLMLQWDKPSMLPIFHKMNFLYTRSYAFEAAIYGSVACMTWMMENYTSLINLQPAERLVAIPLIQAVIRGGHRPIFDLLARYGTIWDEDVAVRLILSGQGLLFMSLAEAEDPAQRCRYRPLEVAYLAIATTDFTLLEWLFSRGELNGKKGLKIAAAYGHLVVVQWLSQKGFPLSSGILKAIEIGAPYYRIPVAMSALEAIKLACSRGPVTKWLRQQGYQRK